MKKIKIFFSFLMFACFLSCNQPSKDVSDSFIGVWFMEEQIGCWEYLEPVDSLRLENDPLYLPEKQYHDYTKSYWDAHDALSYTFNSDGTLIISGGPEPIEGISGKFKIERSKLDNDSVLYIECSEYPDRFTTKFEILSINSDSIWLCRYDKDDILGTSNYCYLVKSKN